MQIEQRLRALIGLGQQLLLDSADKERAIQRALAENHWFSESDIRQSIHAIATQYLSEPALRQWLTGYELPAAIEPKIVGTVLAGNIPLVGFHDLLCVFISGHKAQVKLSSKDSVMMRYIIDLWCEIEPLYANYCTVSEQLKGFDAVIATGSNNSSRYFDYYFGNYPHIIRRNRHAVAVLSGNESKDELVALGIDVFSYCGLGCRNVSKLFVPPHYDFTPLLQSWQIFDEVMLRDKYKSNYDYQRTLLLLNREDHLAADFVMLRQYADAIASPISVVYYEVYDSQQNLAQRLNSLSEQIQCVVGNNSVYEPCIAFGKAQLPALHDYADGVDTLRFLLEL
jgi:hypothetical protein